MQNICDGSTNNIHSRGAYSESFDYFGTILGAFWGSVLEPERSKRRSGNRPRNGQFGESEWEISPEWAGPGAEG